jgi:hypothetical protein
VALKAACYRFERPSVSKVLLPLPTPPDYEGMRAPFGSTGWGRVSPVVEACALVVLSRLCSSKASFRAFIGTNPIALRPERVDQIAREEYAVSPKIHGERFLLMASGDRWLAFDRSARVYVASRPGARPEDGDTVLDVERRGDQVFVLDVLRAGRDPVRQLPLDRRLAAARDLVFGGRLKVPRFAADRSAGA